MLPSLHVTKTLTHIEMAELMNSNSEKTVESLKNNNMERMSEGLDRYSQNDKDIIINEIYIAIRHKQLSSALTLCESLIEQSPKDVKLYKLKINILELRKQPLDVLAIRRMIIQMGFASEEDYLKLCRSYFSRRMFQACKEIALEGVQQFPQHQAKHHQDLIFMMTSCDVMLGENLQALSVCKTLDMDLVSYVEGWGLKSTLDLIDIAGHEVVVRNGVCPIIH